MRTLSLIVALITTASLTTGCSSLTTASSSTNSAIPNDHLDSHAPLTLQDARRMLTANPSSLGMIMNRPLTGGSFYKPVSLGNDRYLTKDGEVLKLPKEDGVSRDATSSSCTSTAWSGNTPPSCATTGAFRRVYSFSGNNVALVRVTLPSYISTMSANSPHDGGYIYMEGWPGANQANTEAGLIYSPKNNDYVMYISPSSQAPSFSPMAFEAGDQVDIGMTTFNASAYGSYADCSSSTCMEAGIFDLSNACQTGSTNGSYACQDGDEINDAGWSQNCCIFARMTTIAQPPASVNFSDGSKFGSIGWSVAEVGPYSSTGNTPAWSGGSQSWPNDSTINIVNYTNLSNESDTIYFHP